MNSIILICKWVPVTTPSSTLQNQGIFSSFIIYVILVPLAFVFPLSRLNRALEGTFAVHLQAQRWWTVSKSSSSLDLGTSRGWLFGDSFGRPHLVSKLIPTADSHKPRRTQASKRFLKISAFLRLQECFSNNKNRLVLTRDNSRTCFLNTHNVSFISNYNQQQETPDDPNKSFLQLLWNPPI